eukprot:3763779-Rhodomonas_salina.1
MLGVMGADEKRAGRAGVGVFGRAGAAVADAAPPQDRARAGRDAEDHPQAGSLPASVSVSLEAEMHKAIH